MVMVIWQQLLHLPYFWNYDGECICAGEVNMGGGLISNEGSNCDTHKILPQSEYPVPCVCYGEFLQMLRDTLHHLVRLF